MTTKQKYGIRKLSIGAASCFLGSVLYFGGGMVVNADEVQPTDVTPVAEETTVAGPVTEMPEVPTVVETPVAATVQESAPVVENTAPATDNTATTTTAQQVEDPTLQVQEGSREGGINVVASGDETTFLEDKNLEYDYGINDAVNRSMPHTIETTGDYSVYTFTNKDGSISEFIGVNVDTKGMSGKKITPKGGATIRIQDAANDKYGNMVDMVIELNATLHGTENLVYVDDSTATRNITQYNTGNSGFLRIADLNDEHLWLADSPFMIDTNANKWIGAFLHQSEINVKAYLVDKSGNVVQGTVPFAARDLDAGASAQYKDHNHTPIGVTSEGVTRSEGIALTRGVVSDVYTTSIAPSLIAFNEETGYIGRTGDVNEAVALTKYAYETYGVDENGEMPIAGLDDNTFNSGFVTLVDASGFEFTWTSDVTWYDTDLMGKDFDSGRGIATALFYALPKNILPEDTLRYEPNGGTGTMTNTDGHSGELVTVKENEFTRDGYKFIGWNTLADGSGEVITTDYMLQADFDDVVYAQWEKIPTTEWVDEDGNPLKDPEEGTFPDKEGDDIPGYKLTEIKTEEGTTINVYHKVQTHWVDEQGNPLKDSVDGTYPDKEGDDIDGWEIVRTYVNDKGDTVNVYKKKAVPAAPKAQPATPAPAPIQTGMESGIASMAGTMFASIGALVGLKKKKED